MVNSRLESLIHPLTRVVLTPCRSARSRSQLQSHQRTLEFSLRLLKIFFGATPRAQLFFSMFAREAGAGGVDLFGPFGDFGEHRNAIVVDFEETARDMQLKVRAVLIVGEHSGFQFRDERRVAGKKCRSSCPGCLMPTKLSSAMPGSWRGALLNLGTTARMTWL